jgi:GMP synthase (glutamine-hydrolysing)
VSEVQKMIDEGKIIEPLKELYKDEVRKLGEELGLPYNLVHRHPFPGPGLAIRVICSDGVKSETSFNNEEIFMNEILIEYGMIGKILPIKSVGVQGDFRTYHHPAVVWFKKGEKKSWEKITGSSSKVINKLKTVNRLIFSLNPVNALNLETLFLEKGNLNELKEVDAYFREKTDKIKEIWQMPVVQLPIKNNENRFSYVIRPVCSQDAMSASVYEMDFDYFNELVDEVQNNLKSGYIFYDVTSKPPGTIEWE